MKLWFARLGALFTTFTLTILVPAAAWASTNGVADALIEDRRRRGGGFGFGIVGILCCLGVVAVIVVVVLLLLRNRGRKR